MYCVKCGGFIQEGERFCKQCGQPVAGNGQIMDVGKAMGKNTRKKAPVGVVIAAGILGGLILVGAATAIVTYLVIDSHTVSSVQEETSAVNETIETTEEVEEIQTPQKSDEVSKALQQTPEEFKQSCKYYTYDQLARNPKDYMGLPVVLYGEVVQVMETGDDVQLRVNITEGVYNWQNAIYVEYTRKMPNESRILEGDLITLWGISNDTISYETVVGNALTVPYVKAEYIEQGIIDTSLPEEEWVEAERSQADYIIPYSDVYYLTNEDLRYLTKEELRLARNEIYARHGRMFKAEDLQNYFNSKPWYTQMISADDFNDNMLSEVEKYNADFIKAYEDQLS